MQGQRAEHRQIPRKHILLAGTGETFCRQRMPQQQLASGMGAVATLYASSELYLSAPNVLVSRALLVPVLSSLTRSSVTPEY